WRHTSRARTAERIRPRKAARHRCGEVGVLAGGALVPGHDLRPIQRLRGHRREPRAQPPAGIPGRNGVVVLPHADPGPVPAGQCSRVLVELVLLGLGDRRAGRAAACDSRVGAKDWVRFSRSNATTHTTERTRPSAKGRPSTTSRRRGPARGRPARPVARDPARSYPPRALLLPDLLSAHRDHGRGPSLFNRLDEPHSLLTLFYLGKGHESQPTQDLMN